MIYIPMSITRFKKYSWVLKFSRKMILPCFGTFLFPLEGLGMNDFHDIEIKVIIQNY